MKNLFILVISFLMISCASQKDNKIKVYAWLGGPGKSTDAEIKSKFEDLRDKGIDGLMYNAGWDIETYSRAGKIARKAGLEFNAWIPTLIQNHNDELKPEWYAINGAGESAYDKPAYVEYYHFVCPNREEVCKYLEVMYGKVADLPEVDGIHLDFIRYPDVILAKGLWEKYGLVMDKEYPQYDYCYCDKCISDFMSATGIDIRSAEDPSQVMSWKQFRYDRITNLVNRLAKVVHSKGKKITAAVFPGPDSFAKKLVRQEWEKWKIDGFFPMLYNDFYLEDTSWIGRMCREGVAAVNNSIPVYSGLFICPEPEKRATEKDPENKGLSPGELESAITESIQNGAAGICLFTPDRMTSEDWSVLRKVIHSKITKNKY